MNDEEAGRKALARAGARAGGVALGAGLSTLGGPVGLVLGQVTGYAVGEVVAWLASIAYAPLEGPKVQAALSGADEVLSARSDETTRADGFFSAVGYERPPAVEFFEGAMRAAARAHEARKAAYLGRFWANLAYESDIDFQRAAYLLRLAGELTYRQLVLAAIFVRAESDEGMRERLETLNATTGDDESTVAPDCAEEMQDLADRGVLGFLNSESRMVINTIAANEGRFAHLDLSRIRPMGAGSQLARLLSLHSMASAELEPVVMQLG
jgi:hypothetical protein